MQRFRKPLLILAAISAGFVVILLLASLLLASKAKSLAVDQINRYLSVPVQVKDIHFSLIRNFPYASVNFEGLSTRGSATQGALANLADAEEIHLLYNLLDIFSDELHLKKIIIRNASFYFYTDTKGDNNFNIFKKQTNSGAGTRVELEKVLLENVRVSYVDLPGRRDYRLNTADMELNGAFSNDVYDLKIKGPVFAERIRLEDVNYLDHKETGIDALLNIDTRKKQYTIGNSTVQVADMLFTVDGRIAEEAAGNNYDLRINSREAGIRELLSLIPGIYKDGLNRYTYDGKAEFKLLIKGLAGRKSSPLVTATFKASIARLNTSGTDYAFSNIRLDGDYTSRISDSRPVSRLRLKQLSANLEGQPLSGNLLLEDFSNPVIDMKLNSRINLEVLSRFWLPDTLSSMQGQVAVNAHIRGRSKDRSSWISEGSLEASNVSFSIKNRKQPYTGISGRITLQGSKLLVNGLRCNAGGSDFTFNGSFDNAYGYVLTKTESINGNLSVNCANVDLNELLEDESSTASDTVYRFDLDPRIHMSLQANIGMMRFRKFEAWQVKGRLEIDGKILRAQNISFRGFEGSTMLSGELNATRADSINIVCEAEVRRLDINTLFFQLGNFGQDVIKSDNVSGKLTAGISFAGTWSKGLHCNMDRIVAQCNLLIENGELKQFKPILALNKYLKGADLQHIRFNTLKNQISIRNQTITIPAMQIQSSALDLTASGTHTFSNVIDYKLQLYLSQLIGKKVKNQNTEFGYIEDDGLGRMKVFLTMKGPMANPKVVFDKKGVEQKITQDIKKEKTEFRNIIREEFGLGKKDTASRKSPPKKQQELELDLE